MGLKTFLIKNNCIKFILFLVVFLIYIFANITTLPIMQRIGEDEFGTIANAAYLAGLDWTNVMSNGKYYGLGYSLFLLPIFWITESPILLYRLMLMVNGAVNACTAVICYCILYKILPQKNILCKFFLSIALVFFPVKFLFVINEHMIIFLIWTCIYLLIRLSEVEDNPKDRTKYTIFLVLVLFYGLLVHTRMLLLCGIVVIVALLYYACSKEELVNGKLFFGGVFISYFFANEVIIKIYQRSIWQNVSSNTELANTSDAMFSTIVNKLDNIFCMEGIKTFVFTCVSQFTVGIWMTLGLLGVGLVCAIVFITRFILGNSKEQNKAVFLASIVGVIGLIGMIMGHSLMQLPDFKVLDASLVENAIYGGRMKVYQRYFICYGGPLIIPVVYAIDKYGKYVKKYSILYVLAVSCVSKYVLFRFGDKYAEFKMISSPTYQDFSFYGEFIGQDNLTHSVFAIALMISLLFCGIIVICVYRRKLTLLVAVIAILYISKFYYSAYTYNRENSQRVYNRNIEFYKIIERVEAYGELPNRIYVLGESAKDEYRLQFFLNQYSLICNETVLEEEAIVIVRSAELENVDMSDYHLVKVGNIGFIGVKGESLISLFECTEVLFESKE